MAADEVWMHYGAADTAIGLTVAKTSDLLAFVRRHDYLHKVGHQKGTVS